MKTWKSNDSTSDSCDLDNTNSEDEAIEKEFKFDCTQRYKKLEFVNNLLLYRLAQVSNTEDKLRNEVCEYKKKIT